MAVVLLSTPVSTTAEPCDRVIKQLDPSGAGGPLGRQFHPCFGPAHHVTVFDVWDRADEFQAFGMTLGSTLAEEQVEMAPAEPLEIHRLIEGGDASVLRKTIAELRNTAFFKCQVGKYHEAMEKSSGEANPSGSATT